MGRDGLSIVEARRRLRVAADVAQAGGNGTAFAAKAGLKPAAAINWLADNHPDLHRQLTNGPRGARRTRHQALVLLLLLKSAEGFRGGQGRIARALGLSAAAISEFKRKWASDGLDAAIADLMPDDTEAAHG